jgi:hypothetical protein
MLCALTVRTLRPGTFEQFCFGFYDGIADELRSAVPSLGYAEQQQAIAPLSTRWEPTGRSRSSRTTRRSPPRRRPKRRPGE